MVEYFMRGIDVRRKKKMLELQKFLNEHPNDYEEILTQKPYCLKIKHKDTRVLFKYDQVESDFHEPIVCESRGIILEEGTWKVLRLAFYKFFNQGESLAADIDWDSADANEKIDGSLMSVYWYDGQWRLASNGTIDAYDANVNVFDADGNLTTEKISFGEIFESILPLSAFDKYGVHKTMCYTFELVSPKTTVIIKYDEPGLYLLSARDMPTLQEVRNPETYLPANMMNDFGIKLPQKFETKGFDSFKKIVEEMDGDDHEGIVVFDKNFNRVKMKTIEYLTKHYYKGAGINLDRLATVVATNEDSEFLSYFPEHKESVNKLHKYVERLKKFADTCDGNLAVFDVDLFGIMSIIDPKERRKFFASWVMKHFGNDPYKKGLLFKGYDKKACETVSGWSQNKWIDFMKYAVEHPEEWGN